MQQIYLLKVGLVDSFDTLVTHQKRTLCTEHSQKNDKYYFQSVIYYPQNRKKNFTKFYLGQNSKKFAAAVCSDIGIQKMRR